MTLKSVTHMNPIRETETLTKYGCSICMEECLIILIRLREKCHAYEKITKIYRDFRHKKTFHQFSLGDDDPIIK